MVALLQLAIIELFRFVETNEANIFMLMLNELMQIINAWLKCLGRNEIVRNEKDFLLI